MNDRYASESGKSLKKKGFFKRLGRVRTAVLFFLVILLCVSSYLFFDTYFQYRAGDNLYANLEHNYLVTAVTVTPPLNTPTPVPSAPVPSDDPGEIIDEPPPEETPAPGESVQPTTNVVKNYAPDIWPDVDWDGLKSINSDTAAWLLCVGTNINYPVVYSHDNVDYLKTMFDGNSSKVGTLFVDARNSKGFTDRNTIIYGHNMRNQTMFWTLTQYKSQSFYNKHPSLRLVTPEGKFEIQLFAGIVAKATEIDTFWKLDFNSDDEYIEWILMLFENSTFKSYVDLTAEDKVVTLSTCSYEFDNARYIVIGKLIPVA